MTDRIYAVMDRPEGPLLATGVNRAWANSGFEQLPTRDHTVLPFGQPRNDPV